MSSLNYSTSEDVPPISIGVPVFDGEKSLNRAIESLLSQTFSDFEIIISDNASTDQTEAICKQYVNKDKRIKYFRQKQNQGAIKNFEILLRLAKGKYFMWAAADDFWHPSFLEKNYEILESCPQVVATISKVKMARIVNKSPKLVGTYPLTGNTTKRLRQYFQCLGANSRFYSLYRSEVIKQCFVPEVFMGGMDGCTIINVLKHGEFYEIDEVLMERSCYGSSSKLLIEQFRSYDIRGIEKLFPLLKFNIWFWKNSNKSVFFKCIDYLLRLNLFFLLIVISEVLKIRKPKKYSNYS